MLTILWPRPQAEIPPAPSILSHSLPFPPCSTQSFPPLFGINPAMTIRSLIKFYFIVFPFSSPVTLSPQTSTFMSHALHSLELHLNFCLFAWLTTHLSTSVQFRLKLRRAINPYAFEFVNLAIHLHNFLPREWVPWVILLPHSNTFNGCIVLFSCVFSSGFLHTSRE